MLAEVKFATIAYVPPPRLPYSSAFYDNMQSHKTKHDLLLYSEHSWPGARRFEGSAEALQGVADASGAERVYNVSNLVFYSGMAMAERAGYTHVLYVEADSRVARPDWDARIFDDFLNQRMPPIIGGSVAVHNPSNFGGEGIRRWAELTRRNVRRNHPIPTYGNLGTKDKGNSCVFCYGSGTVIDMEWYRRLFTEEERTPDSAAAQASHQFGIERRTVDGVNGGADGFGMMKLARASRAWDIELGVRIWKQFGPDAYDLIAHLGTVFSSFGNVLTCEHERLEMLRTGEAELVHQVKSDARI